MAQAFKKPSTGLKCLAVVKQDTMPAIAGNILQQRRWLSTVGIQHACVKWKV